MEKGHGYRGRNTNNTVQHNEDRHEYSAGCSAAESGSKHTYSECAQIDPERVDKRIHYNGIAFGEPCNEIFKPEHKNGDACHTEKSGIRFYGVFQYFCVLLAKVFAL